MDLAKNERQRAADVVAVMLLTYLLMNGEEADLSRLGPMVAAYCASQSREILPRYRTMDWQQALRELKIAFAKHHLASRSAGPEEILAPEVDERIGTCLLSAFFKFVTFRSIDPGWYAPHLGNMRFVGTP